MISHQLELEVGSVAVVHCQCQPRILPAHPMEDVVCQAQYLIDILAGNLGSSILHTHPNDLGAGVADYLVGSEETSERFRIHPSWSSWWNWAFQDEKRWRKLIQEQSYINASTGDSQTNVNSIPDALYNLLSEANCHSLPRFRDLTSVLRLAREGYANLSPPTPANIQFKLESASHLGPSRVKHPVGTSMKKVHEVTRMTSCVTRILEDTSNALGYEVRHIVDIGSGQVRVTNSNKVYLHSSYSPMIGLFILLIDGTVLEIRMLSRS